MSHKAALTITTPSGDFGAQTLRTRLFEWNSIFDDNNSLNQIEMMATFIYFCVVKVGENEHQFGIKINKPKVGQL